MIKSSEIEVSCQNPKCGKTFVTKKSYFRENSKHKPKFCCHRCYGESRILPPEELKKRRKLYFRTYMREYMRKRKLKAATCSQTHPKDFDKKPMQRRYPA